MANEITVLSGLQVTKGQITLDRRNPSSRVINMAGDDYHMAVISIPTAAAGTALSLGLVGTAGVCQFKNLDAVNFFDLGVQVGGVFYPCVRFKATEQFTFRLATNAPFVKADTLAVKAETIIVED